MICFQFCDASFKSLGYLIIRKVAEAVSRSFLAADPSFLPLFFLTPFAPSAPLIFSGALNFLHEGDLTGEAMEKGAFGMEERNADILILGAGCAGLTAGLYAARAGKRTVILERGVPGGQAALPGRIDNYPGLPGIDGASLMQRLRQQACDAGAELICTDVRQVSLAEKRVQTGTGDFSAPAMILATGAEPRTLGIPGEARFRGRGVSYCASCDGFFYRGREVYVVGGGNSAGEEALHLAQLASRVHILVRGGSMRCDDATARQLRDTPNIHVALHRALREIRGGENIETLLIEDTESGAVSAVGAKNAGVFIFIGYRPASGLFAGALDMDENGYLLTDENLQTNIPGVFAAGDVRQKTLRQIVTAAADGALAAVQACKFLQNVL